MAKRIEQLAAVKNIQKLDDSKRKILLDQISAKLFQVLAVSKTDLESSGVVPGASNPSPQQERLSLVLENVCLACDLLLRLPDPIAYFDTKMKCPFARNLRDDSIITAFISPNC